VTVTSRERGVLARTVATLLATLLVVAVLSGCWSSADEPDPNTPKKPTVAAADVRYVSPDGDDAWAGTEARPWRSLGYAMQELSAGQLLYVRGGTYREQLVRLNIDEGTADQRIIVAAYPGERPVLRGLFWLREPSYWTFDGINVTWDDRTNIRRQHMVKITGGTGWVWRRSEIWGARAGANVLIAARLPGDPADWAFTENCVHDLVPTDATERSSSITIGDMEESAGPGEISRNIIFGSAPGRHITFGFDRAGSTGGPANITLAYNNIYGSDVAVSLAGDSTGVVIERNIMGGPASGVLVRTNRLAGPGNLVRENVGVNARRFFFQQAPGDEPGQGNIYLDDVGFDDVTTCEGLRSSEGVALSYGRDAIQ
jgi:hypothetical protein